MKYKYYYIALIFLFFIFITPFNGAAEEVIKKGESLNLERCVEIALKMHPGIIAAKNTVNANESRVEQSRANYYPQINWSSSYSRISPTSGTASGSFGRTDSFDEYSNGFNLSQTIYDFGKTPTQIKIQDFNSDSSRSDLENVTEQVILNVKQTYYGVLQAKRNRDVSAESVKQFEQHLEQAKAFYTVGTKPKFDVTKAEVDLSNSKLNLIRSENVLRLAVVKLNNAMGVPDAPEYILEDNLSLQKYNITFEDALTDAYKNRPDLKSIIAKKKAAEESIELAKKGYYPVLTGNAAYNWSGERFPLEHGWNVGATLSFPIFSGFLTKYQVEEAKANLNVLTANEESVKQTVSLEVQQAYLNLKDAEERIPTAELTVRQAEENFEIANGRYTAGVGNPIEVTDAEVSLSNAKTAYIQALYDYKVAWASLEKAMGIR
ncbi:MAG: TolC family protein [Nitrospira sp.]|nr:TolC family protein [Nitrospira sp.]